jgi:23S rRNA pseudouridine1911/1915/1917 synthase
LPSASNNPARSGGKTFQLTLPVGVRLDKFLSEALAEQGEEISRSRLQRLIEEGGVSGIDLHKIKASYKAKRETAIGVVLPAEQEIPLKPLSIEIPVLYEDNQLAIVHKPAGMTVHPGAGTGDDTLVHALLANVDRLAPHAERPGIVHRLDRETEGIMIVAKTEKARVALSKEFAARNIKKVYTAFVWGRVTFPEEVRGFIWRDVHNRKKMRFGLEVPERITRAREAHLDIVAQKQFKYGTRLEIELITGRTHQIRATCVFFNAPVIGDALYGSDGAKFKLYKIGKEKRRPLEDGGMLLLAQKVAFKHPFSLKKLQFSLPLPERFLETEQILM